MLIKEGKHRAEKIRYKDGVGCTIWTPLKAKDGEEDEEAGICYDFGEEDIPEMIKILKALQEAEAEVYVPDPEYEKYEEKQKEKEKTLRYKIYEVIEDIGIAFNPFDWRYRKLFVTRTIPAGKKKGSELVYKLCKGICFGPFVITW